MTTRSIKPPAKPVSRRGFEILPLGAALVPVIGVQHAATIVPGGIATIVRALHGGVEVYESGDTLLISLSALSMHRETTQHRQEVA